MLLLGFSIYLWLVELWKCQLEGSSCNHGLWTFYYYRCERMSSKLGWWKWLTYDIGRGFIFKHQRGVIFNHKALGTQQVTNPFHRGITITKCGSSPLAIHRMIVWCWRGSLRREGWTISWTLGMKVPARKIRKLLPTKKWARWFKVIFWFLSWRSLISLLRIT